jgi:hypothetical protein
MTTHGPTSLFSTVLMRNDEARFQKGTLIDRKSTCERPADRDCCDGIARFDAPWLGFPPIVDEIYEHGSWYFGASCDAVLRKRVSR